VIVAQTATVYAFQPHVGKCNDLTPWIAQPRNSPDHLAGHPSEDYQCRRLSGIDHIAITVSDLKATSAFYDRRFGARTHLERTAEGKVKVR
jgi:glyoxalase/bleomycin resistance protein/dioxygenase superfamily protein